MAGCPRFLTNNGSETAFFIPRGYHIWYPRDEGKKTFSFRLEMDIRPYQRRPGHSSSYSVIMVRIDSPTFESFIYIASVISVMDPLLDQSSICQCPRPVTEVKLPVMQLGVNSTFLIHLRIRNVPSHYIYPL